MISTPVSSSPVEGEKTATLKPCPVCGADARYAAACIKCGFAVNRRAEGRDARKGGA